MTANLIILVLAALFLASHGQEREPPIANFLTGRTSNVAFDNQFNRGPCPPRFYHLGEECVYFANTDPAYPWKRAESFCSRRIAAQLNKTSAGNSERPNLKPVTGVRQLVLNTPAKTELLRGLLREYEEQHFAVRLLPDYNTLHRCEDGQDDKWPRFCGGSQPTNSSCIETATDGGNEICVREVDCNSRTLRFACEFTLPGGKELIKSDFHNCQPVQAGRRGLPRWAWIAIIIGSVLLVLIILGVIFLVVRNSKGKGGSKKRNLPEPPPPSSSRPETTVRIPVRPKEQTTEPLLTRSPPTNEPDYLVPRSAPTDNTANS